MGKGLDRVMKNSGSFFTVGLAGLAIFVLFSSLASGEIYKWVDENGKIHYDDRPPQTRNAQRLEISIETYSSVQTQSYDGELTSAGDNKSDQQKKVVMYSTEWCGVCKKAKAYFKANKIPFREYDVEKSQKARRAYKKLKAKGVPVILVGKKRMNGFSAASFEKMYYN